MTENEGTKNHVRGKIINGKLFPVFTKCEEIVPAIRHLSVRPDDVLVVGYPRSGNHWVVAIIKMLLTGDKELHMVRNGFDYLDCQRAPVYDQCQSPRMKFTHLTYDMLPEGFFNKNKAIHISRDPRDVVNSLYPFTTTIDRATCTWSDYLQVFLNGKVCYGSWFDFERHWEGVKKAHPEHHILHVCYEDLKQNTAQCIKKMADFLEVDRSLAFCTDVAEACSIKNMRMKKYDPATEKLIIYRKGEIGDWKTSFSVAQSEAFDKVYSEKMQGSARKLMH